MNLIPGAINMAKTIGQAALGSATDAPEGQQTIVVQEAPKTGFDRFIDAVSRLPRLLMLFGSVAILCWPIWDTEGFTLWALAVEKIPENIWMLIFMVFSSWAATKFTRDFKARGKNGTVFQTGGQQGYGGGFGGGYGDDMEDYGRFNNIAPDAATGVSTNPHNDSIEAWKNQLP